MSVLATPLIPIIPIISTIINNEEINSVSGKTLYETLELKRDFSDWIKNQIERADLIENVDFILHHIKGEQKKGSGGHNAFDYILTVDSAKHIAMMSQSRKSKKIRDYFISIEKAYIAELKAKATQTISKTPQPQIASNTMLSHPRLTGGEKVVADTIRKLCMDTGWCIASNVMIGNILNLTEDSVDKTISTLYKKEIIRNIGHRRERKIVIITDELQEPTPLVTHSEPMQIAVEQGDTIELISTSTDAVVSLELALELIELKEKHDLPTDHIKSILKSKSF